MDEFMDNLKDFYCWVRRKESTRKLSTFAMIAMGAFFILVLAVGWTKIFAAIGVLGFATIFGAFNNERVRDEEDNLKISGRGYEPHWVDQYFIVMPFAITLFVFLNVLLVATYPVFYLKLFAFIGFIDCILIMVSGIGFATYNGRWWAKGYWDEFKEDEAERKSQNN